MSDHDYHNFLRPLIDRIKLDFLKLPVQIVEAAPRNTAAAIAFAAFAANAEDILVVTPADHIIENDKAYQKAIEEAINLAKENNLVTFGVQPDRPETGYGYIEFSGNDVIGFREKPDAKTASSNRENPPKRSIYCLGRDFLESGHSRLPTPPVNKT